MLQKGDSLLPNHKILTIFRVADSFLLKLGDKSIIFVYFGKITAAHKYAEKCNRSLLKFSVFYTRKSPNSPLFSFEIYHFQRLENGSAQI